MPLMLDAMREEFARFLSADPAGRFRMDAALAHVVTLAYQRGIADAGLLLPGAAEVKLREALADIAHSYSNKIDVVWCQARAVRGLQQAGTP